MSDQFGKAFCVLPWLHSFVNIGGEYQVCCTSEEFHRGILNTEGKVFNIKDKPTIEEVMNSDFMNKLRLEMLEGKWPELCSRCVVTENMGGTSRRHLENEKYADLAQDLKAFTSQDGRIPIDIKSADYRLGNICNLECRMCGPRSSVMWLKDWNEVKDPHERIDEALTKEYSEYDWINDDHLIQEFESKVTKIDTLHFAGGEPLIAPKMREILQICVDKGVASKILLTYNTNITRLPEKVLELWKHFKEVRLLCSVDGFGKVNDYIRMPVMWEIIDKNLRYLDQHAEELKLSEILLSCTVQAYNVLNLNDLYEYLGTFKNVLAAPNLINLFGPDYLRTQVLPLPIKKEAIRRLQPLKKELQGRLPSHKHYLIQNIDQIINFMLNKDLSSHLWKDFVAYNQRIDAKKGMNLGDYIPELHSATQRYV